LSYRSPTTVTKSKDSVKLIISHTKSTFEISSISSFNWAALKNTNKEFKEKMRSIIAKASKLFQATPSPFSVKGDDLECAAFVGLSKFCFEQ